MLPRRDSRMAGCPGCAPAAGFLEARSGVLRILMPQPKVAERQRCSALNALRRSAQILIGGIDVPAPSMRNHLDNRVLRRAWTEEPSDGEPAFP